LQLAAGQAEYVLNHLLASGRLGRADVREALDEMGREIKTLEQRLASLRDAAGGSGAAPSVARRGPGRPAAQPAADEGTPTRAGKRRRRKATLSPKAKASQVIQGQYLGAIAQIPKTRRAKYKAIAMAKGREAAITEMRKALKK
jgi:hypothetical protein